MKRLVVLVALAAVACGKEANKETKKAKVPAQVEQKKVGELKIAFYDQDSLKLYFDYYREQDSLFQKKQLSFQNEVDRMSREYQEFLQRNDEKARQGLLSQIQIQKIQEEAANKERRIVEFQQTRGGQLERETVQKLEEIGNKIDVYSKQFCEENKLDILLIKAKGGQVAYMVPSMDLTEAFIAYLNEHEKEIQKDMAKAK